jgi:glycolate oxidase
VAGLDLTSLFIGSEGTLGVITAATVRLRPAPAAPPAVFVASFSDLPAAGDAVALIVASGAAPSMLELIDSQTIIAIEDYRRMGWLMPRPWRPCASRPEPATWHARKIPARLTGS